MRLYRNAIILVIIVGLLAGAYFLMKNKQNVDQPGTTETENTKATVLLDIKKDNISEMTVENANGKYVFIKKGQEWTLADSGSFKLNKDKVDSLAGNVSYISSNKLIEEKATKLEDYGLDKPVTVSVKLSDGSKKELEVGNKTPTEDGFYAKLKGEAKVHTISTFSVENIVGLDKNSLMDKTLFTFKKEDITGLALEKDGAIVFSSKKVSDSEWRLTAPFDYKAYESRFTPIIEGLSTATIMNLIEEAPSDLDKYGLKNPLYGVELDIKGAKTKLLIGYEKEKNTEVYVKLADKKEVFTMDAKLFNFVDKPLVEAMDPFVFIPNIQDVAQVIVEMDGQKVTSDIQVNASKEDPNKTEGEEKFFVNGKDATVKDDNDNFLFKKYYQALIGITISGVDANANPQGKPEITFTFTLEKEPKSMKVEFIPKDKYNYYVVKNGVYAKVIVAKDKFDEADGVRNSYKALIDAMNKKK